jgi:hypothetical protein
MIVARTLALLLALLLASVPSGAGPLELNELGAALALPVLTRDGTVTIDTITNGKHTPVVLVVDVIDGERCTSNSFECPLTGRETTAFVFSPQGSGSRLDVECTDLGSGAPTARSSSLSADAGFLFVALADPGSRKVISEDVLFGDAVIVDVVGGGAFSFEAISFQAGQGLNDGDKVYHFDGLEYERFPALLVGGPSMLFTLDMTLGQLPLPRVRLGAATIGGGSDGGGSFECFSLSDVTGPLDGIPVLAPQPAATANDAHDALFGDGNDVRRRPVHGWQLIDGRGLPLGQGSTALLPFLGDLDPVLDADPTR